MALVAASSAVAWEESSVPRSLFAVDAREDGPQTRLVALDHVLVDIPGVAIRLRHSCGLVQRPPGQMGDDSSARLYHKTTLRIDTTSPPPLISTPCTRPPVAATMP